MNDRAGRRAFPADDDFAPDRAASCDDERWISVALALARRGLGRTAPNPTVGAVLVRDGVVVGRGWTQPGGRPHAETVALAAAGEAARGATLYVTLEPCSHFGRTPPCADAVVAAGVTRVVAAMGDPDMRVAGRGFARLREAGLEVVTGVGEAEAARLVAGHVLRVTEARPLVSLKLAVSRDGKVAHPGGQPAAITGEASRARTHLMRAEADAILIGVGTLLVDDPELTCRLPGMAERSPVRIVLDAGLRTPPTARLVTSAREVASWIVGAVDAPAGREQALRAAGAEVMRVGRGPDGRLAPREVLALLAARGVTRLMVEGGPTVARALLEAGLVDEATVLTGPVELGEGAPDAFPAASPDSLVAAGRMRLIERRVVGRDAWTRYERT